MATNEIGEHSVEIYGQIVASASRGERNEFLTRAIEFYGEQSRAIDAARTFDELITTFAKRFGADRRICLYESPGRVNLMGTHIDHRGGYVNPVATQERIRAVCSRRTDDCLCALSTFRDYGEAQFRIAQRLPDKPVQTMGDWLNWTETEAAAHGGGDSFINYFACGPMYLACFHYPQRRSFTGADFVLGSDLPSSAGLASSSALVILATDFFLRCNVLPEDTLTPHQLLDVYGNGEWYVGTRGGKGDHAAIRMGHKDCVRPMITTPDFTAFDPAPFPAGYQIVLYQSGDEANKSVEPFKTGFNAPIISYLAAEMFLADYLRKHNNRQVDDFLSRRADMDPKFQRVYLGDVINHDLLSEPQIYDFLRTLPPVMTKQDIFSHFRDRPESLDDGMSRSLAPNRGYHVRDVAAFGFSECARSKRAASLLSAGDIEGFADMMNTSQLGDRVTDNGGPNGQRLKVLDEDTLLTMQREQLPIHRIAGDYHVSTVNIDRLVSLCLAHDDVIGARLSGAGLGGMLIVLGKDGFAESLDPVLQRDYYEPLGKEFRRIHIVPSQGSAFY